MLPSPDCLDEVFLPRYSAGITFPFPLQLPTLILLSLLPPTPILRNDPLPGKKTLDEETQCARLKPYLEVILVMSRHRVAQGRQI